MLETGMSLDIIRMLTGIFILTYASYTDIKTRKASNINWFLMASIGSILLIIQILNFTPAEFEIKKWYLIFIPIMIGFVYVLFQLRLIFGGADAKALMAIAILVPFQPKISEFPIWSESFMPSSWTIFANSIILFLFIPLFLLLFNITKGNIKFPNCILGYKIYIKKAREKFVWPLEKVVGGKRKFVYMPKDYDVKEEIDEFEKHGINDIWVTPKIPFMIPLLVGFILTFILGDILFIIMNLFT
jgi:preflagellin peptidase FlaK